MAISVIICTRNRRKNLQQCIDRLISGEKIPDEIVIIDQSNRPLRLDESIAESNIIHYYHQNNVGLSRARNLGLTLAHFDICAFTDDDCFVSSSWINEISKYVSLHPDIAAVFGESKPYNPKKNSPRLSPSVNTPLTPSIISTVENIDYTMCLGNNMILRRSVVKEVGLFQPWLGSGSCIGTGGEESEFMYRLVSSGYKIATSPKLIVFHNRWMNLFDYQLLQTRYFAGFSLFMITNAIQHRNRSLFYIWLYSLKLKLQTLATYSWLFTILVIYQTIKAWVFSIGILYYYRQLRPPQFGEIK